MGLSKTYKLFRALHQPVNGCEARSASLAAVLHSGVAVRFYQPAMTQQSGDAVLALVFG
jgi:hypothetical protein